ncbi:S-adenosyl-dependent methyltransferase activity on membrane-located substrates（S-adenosyl-L-methionine-dependent methyltransferase, MraW,7-312&|uniref:16S rRNA (cytosine(1402)-N(4))-methyltransferase RsmH n=1 Tax=Magnetospirillum sp. XM-1 TaxID=1663591 RepID=UPI00073DCD43|nr:16S rRNA (cytosine(1402)-N(4))-methyltransferase RsmH [Magnetospirillum sp. XM-1]CUW38588.1 S-adenosyl-dependent methyltransferase activity on membrane-located substrates\
MSDTSPHIPVLLAEVIAALSPKAGGAYVDGTFGAGGYTKAILSASACRVWAIDRDPTAVARGRSLEQSQDGHFAMIEGRFGDMESLLRQQGVNQVDGIALDIGVSSMQIDQAERGFSFAKDGPLDMRMETKGPSAADMVNDTPEGELADIIYRYGEERLSRRVAKAIVEARRAKRFERTGELAEVVRRVVPRSGDGIDPATRTFQALRIAVNDELGELERGLEAAERLLVPGGRLAVVTFHSLEDRVVKGFLKARSGEAARPSRHVPQAQGAGPVPTFTLQTRKAVAPGPEESRANPRARSAKLRAAIRTDAPARGTAS